MPEGGGKSARPRFYQVTQASVAQMELWADRRNAARLVERVAEPEHTAAEQALAPAPAPMPRVPEQIIYMGDWFPKPQPVRLRINPELIAQARAAMVGLAEARLMWGHRSP